MYIEKSIIDDLWRKIPAQDLSTTTRSELPHPTLPLLKGNPMFKTIAVFFIITFTSLGLASPSWSQALSQHEMLKMDDGKWRADITLYRGEGQPTEHYVGEETNTMVGDLWSVGKLEIDIKGSPYVGFATLGYDPIKDQYVGTWVDSASPHITEMSGTYDAASSTLILFYETIAADGQIEERKNVMVYRDPNRREFEGFIKKEGAWQKTTDTLYKRLE